MASHGVSWVPGTHVRFGNLDFIILMEGELAQVPAAVQTLHSTGLDAITEALGATVACTEGPRPESDQLLCFDYGRLERQVSAFLGP